MEEEEEEREKENESGDEEDEGAKREESCSNKERKVSRGSGNGALQAKLSASSAPPPFPLRKQWRMLNMNVVLRT